MTAPVRRAVLALTGAVAVLLATAPSAVAHPLGNVTTNTSVQVAVGTDALAVTYVLDLAEIPALQARQTIDTDGDDDLTGTERTAWATARCETLLAGVAVVVGADTAALAPTAVPTLSFPEGQAGLSTLRLTCEATATTAIDGPTTVQVTDGTTPERIGWRELVLVGDGTTLDGATVPDASPTDQLRSYPDEQLSSPLRITSGSAEVRPGGLALDGATTAGDAPDASSGPFERLTTAFTDLVAERELTLGFTLLAVLLALVLGALHALAPGHGKTVMAAYAVGQRGTMRHALTIGATVASTHTLGVLLIGIGLSLSDTFVPDRLFGWFEIASGLLVVAIGVALLRRARRGDHSHSHGPGGHTHDHVAAAPTSTPDTAVAATDAGAVATVTAPPLELAEHEHAHVHATDHAAERDDRAMRRRELIGLGVAGGLAPSPSALVVLLGAVAIGRTWFGVGLVVAYGIGLALTLVGAGLLLVRARGLAERVLAEDGTRLARLQGVLPTWTAVAVVGAGLLIATRGLLG